MGADMLVSCAVIGKDAHPNWAAAVTAIAEVAQDADEFHTEGRDLDEEVRPLLTAALERFRKYVEGGYDRQLTCLHVGEHLVYLSGGLSWGDSPTEACEEIDALNACGILQAAGFHP